MMAHITKDALDKDTHQHPTIGYVREFHFTKEDRQ
jgi:hypothetical protein